MSIPPVVADGLIKAIEDGHKVVSSAVNTTATSSFGDDSINAKQDAVAQVADGAKKLVLEMQKTKFGNVLKSGFGGPAQPAPSDPTGGSTALAKMQGVFGFVGFLCFIAGFWAMKEMCPGPFAGKKLMYLLLLIFGGGPVGFVYLVLAYGLKKKIC